MAGLLHAVSWASSERGWGPLREGTAALLHCLFHHRVLLWPLCTVFPLEWSRPQCKGHIFRPEHCIYGWGREELCTAHSVAYSVSQGPFTWLMSGHKSWPPQGSKQKKLLLSKQLELNWFVAIAEWWIWFLRKAWTDLIWHLECQMYKCDAQSKFEVHNRVMCTVHVMHNLS